MKNNSIITLLLVGAFLYTDTAGAGVWTAQGSAGQIWHNPAIPHSGGEMVFQDGKVTNPIRNDSSFEYWVIPFQLSVTNALYTGTQSISGSTQSRLVTFNSNGSVFGATTWTTSSALGSVTVPTDGTLFSQSWLPWTCGPSSCTQSSTLNQIKVTY
jgi:hypothetical protein